ncbi:MAG: Hpt domain-containing protein [Gammaproteobacteria bacterium]|nr:Hpt domain-containing protein [Gammaproteobacteria bacterium]
MNDVLNMVLVEELREIMKEGFPSLIEAFLEDSARQHATAHKAWQSKDFDTLRRSAHSLRGSCANVGAEALQRTCADLENCAKDQLTENITELLSTAGDQLSEVSAAIKTV